VPSRGNSIILALAAETKVRRTAATLVGERGVRRDVIERVLNHTPPKIARTYNRAAYDAEKRQALAILGDLIDAAARGEEERSNLLHLA
jgi:hypothetical protein